VKPALNVPLAIALCQSASDGNLEGVACLIAEIQKCGGSLDEVTRGGSALTHAVWANHLEPCRMLLEAGADIESRGHNGRTALHHAALGRDSHCMALLLAHGADVNAADTNGLTPLMWAAGVNACLNMRLLLEHGADVNAVTKQGKESALHLAASRGQVEACLALLNHGADPNAVDATKRTPLDKAIKAMTSDKRDFNEVVALLLGRGAAPFEDDLEFLAQRCAEDFSLALAEQLMRIGGETALREAAQRSSSTHLRAWFASRDARSAAQAALEACRIAP
jgi:hypothetical protein